MSKSFIIFEILAPYSMESVGLNISCGTCLSFSLWPSSRRINPAADFRPSAACFERSRPSTVLTYAVQYDRSLVTSTRTTLNKQPVTRGEIEDLRGVNTSHILSALQEKGLVVEAGRKEALGRPILYATSEEFLRHFGISSTKELPALPEQ